MVSGTATVASLLVAHAAFAGAHTWRFTEAFSNASGTIQFIELQESGGGDGEILLQGLAVTSNGHTFNFPANLVGPTGNRHLLLATAAFAALPGAPAPDHIIPANFLNPAGDALHYHVYDTWNIQFTPDCVNSVHREPKPPHATTTGPNTPTNYDSQSAQINACPPCPGNIVNTGASANKVDVDDLLAVIGGWGPCPAPPATCPANIVNTGASADRVDVDDLLAVISGWGPCP